MNNFICHLNTKIYFGKGQIEALTQELVGHKNVLLAYGSGSIKINGIYQKVIEILKKESINVWELTDIQPNPRIQTVRKGIELCRDHNVDLILAVGAGSVIDCCKAISLGVHYVGDPWDFFIKNISPEQTIKLGTILTLSATGSEMNPYCVISNPDTGQKYGAESDLILPAFSILDPEHTYTVSPLQTAAGSADILSHVFEQYFCHGNTFVQDRMAEAIMKTVIYWTPLALENPKNYEARANLMWASSIGLNGLLGHGKPGDWASHLIEHELSAVNDLTHGVGLAIIFPNWMSHVLSEETVEQFYTFGIHVWNLPNNENKRIIAEQAIQKLKNFFQEIGLPYQLRTVGFKENELKSIAEKTVSITKSKRIGQFSKLYADDVLQILNDSF